MNARIGNLQQDIDIYKINFTSGLEERKSRDAIEYANGKRFWEFCDDIGLIPLNGRTLGDENVEYSF